MLMCEIFVLCGLLIIASLHGSQSSNIFTHVSPIAKKELLIAFDDVWKLNDIALVHYATTSYRLLKEKLPIPETDVCNFIEKTFSQTNSLESIYHAISIIENIPSCPSSRLKSNAGKIVLESTERENVGIEDLFYISSILKVITSNLTDTAFISKSLKSALKSNETVLNLAYAFHIGSILPKKEIESLFDKINSVMTHVDEVDSKYYQFEGGITLTSLVVEGIYKLSETLNKAPPLTNIQLKKFLNYFLSRMSVSRPRGVFSLLQVLSKLNDNNFHTYVSVVTPDDHVISKEKPTVLIRVLNLFGEALYKDSTPVTVSTFSVQKKNGAATNIKKTLTPTADRITYKISANELDLSPDFYQLTVSIDTNSQNKRSIINPEHTVAFKYTYKIKVENFQIGVLDSEQSSSVDLNKLEYPNKLEEELNVDLQQRLVIKFTLKDMNSGKPVNVQQAFVKLLNKKTGKEAIFVCPSDSNRNFKLTIDPSYSTNVNEIASDDNEVMVIIGDLLVSSSIKWTVATVTFKFLSDQESIQNEDIYYYYRPKPEIKHLFRVPERRPPAVVSNIFTAFVLSPLLILLILWLKLGVNLKNFPFTLSAVGFHLGLGSIFVLFGIFWLKLNMFQIIKYLLLLGAITFLSGNKMLCYIASKRKN